MTRRSSVVSAISLRLDDNILDDRGVAVIDENHVLANEIIKVDDHLRLSANDDNPTIAPWVDVPPTPPPKSPNRAFGFTPKASLSSLVTLRHNSASSIRSRGSDSQSTLVGSSIKRRSTDDDSSTYSRYIDSGSSTHSSERRHKNSLNVNIFSRLKSRGSKATLRPEDYEEEEEPPHPSLRPPVPSLTDSTFLDMSTGQSLVSLASAKKISKIRKGKKSSASGAPPSVAPKDLDETAHRYHIDMDFGNIDEFVNTSASTDPSLHSASISSFPPPMPDYSHMFLDLTSTVEFQVPFLPVTPTPVKEKRKGRFNIEEDILRRVSPTTKILSPEGSSELQIPGKPLWVAPDSWAVTKDQGETGDEGGTDVDEELPPDTESPPIRHGSAVCIDPTALEADTEIHFAPPTDEKQANYYVRILIHGPDKGECSIRVHSSDTVSSLMPILNRELVKGRMLPHRLYLREKGRGDLFNPLERILAPTERPADIVRRRLEQAGYDPSDGMKLLENDGFSFLLSFVYQSELLGTTEAGDQPEDYEDVDLTGRSLRTIPVAVHVNAAKIRTLTLSRNPMLDLPLDFVQDCSITDQSRLTTLRLSNMAMKKVPTSLRHAKLLQNLDLSCNRINDLDDAHLEHIPTLKKLMLQNNRIEKLPFLFLRLQTLTTLNISNNKFTTFPLPATQLAGLTELDVSFNMISELPLEMGRLKELKYLTIVGNQVKRFPAEFGDLGKLQMLDCRRNQISDLSVVCVLPQLRTLKADHNAVHALDLRLGPKLQTLNMSYNDITRLSFVPGPLGHAYELTSLDLSYGKLSSLDDQVFGQLISLIMLKLDHNSFRRLPDTLGSLQSLETLSCSDNKLDSLPETIGRLSKLKTLDAHNNSLRELPESLWNCAGLTTINVTSNFIDRWHDPPIEELNGYSMTADECRSTTSAEDESSNVEHTFFPPLAYSLQKLYMGENKLKDEVLHPMMIFKELVVLNLSFNEIQDLPPRVFKNMPKLEELYLSGNKLSRLPVEYMPEVKNLRVLFLNGNRLQTLPTELRKVQSLRVLDVGSNMLKYNINNWEFDWNWNFNPNLKYLNFSGNKRFHIKADAPKHHMRGDNSVFDDTARLSGFSGLKQLHMLGLMDVTITTNGVDADIPDECDDRRVRTSLSTVNGMGYGIADALWGNDDLNLLDLVHEFRGREGEAIFAIFSRVHQDSLNPLGPNRNRLVKFLHEHFVQTFVSQQKILGISEGGNIRDALRRTFLKLDCDLYKYLFPSNGDEPVEKGETTTLSSGVTGAALYFKGKTMHVANVGDIVAVVSRKGEAEPVSRKHHPYDRKETFRIRAAEGWVSPPGLVNGEIDVSRAFGFYHLLPVINAGPDVVSRELTDLDEFVIVANRGLWDFVPYQTAVDIARTVLLSDKADAMIAAQKLRDFAISYGANKGTMIMVIHLSDLFRPAGRGDPQLYRTPKGDNILDKEISRLTGEVPPPIGHLALVFTDIRNSTHLWEVNPGMPTAMRAHNSLLRRQLRFCGGYEVKTEGDAFMCSFPNALSAVWWCLNVQSLLLQEDWPREILESEDGKPIYDAQGRLIARGLSVRMGIHCGTPVCEQDPVTHRMDYFGPMVNRSARVEGRAAGGQIMCSADVIRELKTKVRGRESGAPSTSIQPLEAIEAIIRMGVVDIAIGEVKLKGLEVPEHLSAIYPLGLEGRHTLLETPAAESRLLDPQAQSTPLQIGDPRLEEPAENDTSGLEVEPTVLQMRELEVEEGVKVQASISQMRDLGMICLRLEALASGRRFRPHADRRSSIQSLLTEENDSERSPSNIFQADPDFLLPTLKENTDDNELKLALDSLSGRINNAVSFLTQMYSPPTISTDDVVNALTQAGGFDEQTLLRIASILQNL